MNPHTIQNISPHLLWPTDSAFCVFIPFIISLHSSPRRTPWIAGEGQASPHPSQPRCSASCWCCSTGDHSWPRPPCPEPSSARLGSAHLSKGKAPMPEISDPPPNPHHTTHTHTLYLNMPNSNSPPAKPLQPRRFLRTSHQSEGSTQAACRAPHPPNSYAVFWNIAMLLMMHIVAYWNAQDVPLTCTQCLVPSGSS